jgi:UDP-2,3-diacylglucosamine pyrophosphatase LpxH
VCSPQHELFLARLPEAVDDAELVVLNGDMIDVHRGLPRGIEADLVARFVELVASWRSEGRSVVYVEGNHDIATDGIPLVPDRWLFDWEGAHGERVRVLHGHRFEDGAFRPGTYEDVGRHILRLENHLYARLAALRASYWLGPGWFAGAVGLAEDVLWTRDFPARMAPLLPDVDVVVHGHAHFGQAHWTVGGKPAWRSGAWVSHGHLGSVDRMLRYRDGKFERIGLEGQRFRAYDDGR